jgi:DNA-binding NtrC family response regulator
MNNTLHPAHILIVEDDNDYSVALQRILKDEFELVDVTSSCTEAISRISGSRTFYDVIIMDQNLENGQSGLECMRNIKHMNDGIEVIMLTGYGEKDLALEALRDGAFRYFYKPANDEELSATICVAYELLHLRKTNSSLKERDIELRNSIWSVLLVSLIANISILLMAVLIKDQFVFAAISFIAILAVLFSGWQGLGKVLLNWKKGSDSFSLNVETIKSILGQGKKRQTKKGQGKKA